MPETTAADWAVRATPGETTTWRRAITEAMARAGDDWRQLVACTLSTAELDWVFDSDFGSYEGLAFTLWTTTRVYFPVDYDGSAWVASVARDPNGTPTRPIGGFAPLRT